MRIVLQVGPRVIADMLAALRPDKAIQQFFASYFDVVDGVLLDISGGRGVPFAEDDMLLMLRSLREDFGQRLMIGAAGGLSAESISTLKPLLRVHPYLSWDAEGRLRDAADDLDLSAATAYLLASHEALTQER